MFSGTLGESDNKRPVVNGEPDENWALCDGSNGTPDLRGRFVLQYNEDYAINTIGGTVSTNTEDTTITIEQMPSHYHSFSAAQALYTNASSSSWRNEATQRTSNTDNTGGSMPHNHSVKILPPYYALAYIMKIA